MEMDAKTLAIALTMLPLAGSAIGLGLIGASWLQGVSRNPGASDKMFLPGMIAAGMTELTALLAFVVAMILKFT